MSHESEHHSHSIWDHLKHFLHDAWHHLWSTLVGINSVLLSLAALYTIYAAFASIYYFTPRPIEIGIILSGILFLTEIFFGCMEEIAG